MDVRVVLIVLFSVTIMPSLAQENPFGLPTCWQKIQDCVTQAGIVDASGDLSVCCPVIKPQVANTTCFCSIKQYIQDIPNEQPEVLASTTELIANKALSDCKIQGSFDQICNGLKKSDSANNLSGSPKTSAIKIATIGFFPGALLIWTILMFY